MKFLCIREGSLNVLEVLRNDEVSTIDVRRAIFCYKVKQPVFTVFPLSHLKGRSLPGKQIDPKGGLPKRACSLLSHKKYSRQNQHNTNGDGQNRRFHVCIVTNVLSTF
jgi:hypothetical protein